MNCVNSFSKFKNDSRLYFHQLCVCPAGYRASGDTDLLQQLCGAAGLPVAVVELVGAATPGSVGPVSSTKVSAAHHTHLSSARYTAHAALPLSGFKFPQQSVAESLKSS